MSDSPSISGNGKLLDQLKPALKLRPGILDSPDQPGKVFQRHSTIAGGGPEAERGEAAPASAPGLSNSHIRSLLCTSKQVAQVEIWRGGSLVHCQREDEFICVATGKRGAVHGFSRKSRSRMIATQAKIRWNTERPPSFMGNTCPDLVPDADHVIGAWSKFNRRFERRFPEGALLWRKEIMNRKSGACEGQWVPHYHSFAYNCPRAFEYQEERGQWVNLRQRKDGGWTLKIHCLDDAGKRVLHSCEEIPPGVTDRLPEWWSRNWYEAMGSGELKHYFAGTSCQQIETVEGVRFYTAKYMAKVEEAGESPHCKGRWWGIVARPNIPWGERIVMECTDEQAITLMRVLRRYVLGKAKRKFRCNHQSMNFLVNDPAQWERFVNWAMGVQTSETPQITI
jgi:hypothetical protein